MRCITCIVRRILCENTIRFITKEHIPIVILCYYDLFRSGSRMLKAWKKKWREHLADRHHVSIYQNDKYECMKGVSVLEFVLALGESV